MAAPTYDNSVQASTVVAGSSITSGSWTIGGTNTFLVGGIASSAGSPVASTSMKWGGSGGTDLTQRGTTITVNSFSRAAVWTLTGPAVSTTTLYGSWGSNQDEHMIMGVSLNGVDPSTPLGTVAQASGSNSNPTVNVTTVADDMVVDFVFTFDNNFAGLTLTVGAGQTSRQELEALGSVDSCGMSTEVATTTTTTMSWTCSSTSNMNWGIFGVPCKPVAAGGSAGLFRINPMSGLGVGGPFFADPLTGV